MTDDLSRELRERLGRVSLPAAPSSLRDEIESLRSTPAATPVRRRSARPPMMMLAAALVTMALVAAGIGGALLRERNEPRQDLSLIVSPSPSTALSTSSSPSPSKLPSASPSPTAVPITWTPASLNEDWPGLVRSEPAGRPIVVPILWKSVVTGTCPDCSYTDTYGHLVDPTGDAGSDALPWADIKDVTFCGICVKIGFVSHPPVRGRSRPAMVRLRRRRGHRWRRRGGLAVRDRQRARRHAGRSWVVAPPMVADRPSHRSD